MREVGELRWGDFKPRLAEALVEHLAPIRSNYAQLVKVLPATPLAIWRFRLAAENGSVVTCAA